MVSTPPKIEGPPPEDVFDTFPKSGVFPLPQTARLDNVITMSFFEGAFLGHKRTNGQTDSHITNITCNPPPHYLFGLLMVTIPREVTIPIDNVYHL